MCADHSEFIARHHRIAPIGEAEPVSRRRWWLLSGAVVAYGAVCAGLAFGLDLPRPESLMLGGGFVLAGALGLAAGRVFGTYSRRDKERALLREVLEGSRGARLLTDGVDNSIYFNQRFVELCAGIGEPNLSTLAQFFTDDDDAAMHFRLLADQAYRGLTDSVELHSVRGDSDYWFMVTAQPVAGWAGYIHWRIDDITEQRASDRAVSNEREKLIDFTDNAPVGFFSVDENGKFVFVNATLVRWLGEDIQNLLAHGRLHTYLDTPPKNARPYDIVDGGGAKQVTEVLMKGPVGKTFMASISQAVVNEAGGVVRTRGVVHDLTSERAMRQALKASEDRFQRFFEDAPLGVAMLDSDGVLADVNNALADMLDRDVHALEGLHFEGLIHEDDRAAVMGSLEKIVRPMKKGAQAMPAPMEVTLHGLNGDVTAQMFARRFRGSDGIVLHFIDLSRQKELEAQFVQSQKMQAIGQLAGGVAHDFNNLLTAMIGFCDLLLLRHKPGDPSFGDIMQIKQNANRAANLVRQLLAFSRQQTLRPKVQDFTDILTETSYLIRRLIGANIELDVIHGADLGLVRVDIGQMEQVLVNLAVNARDAMDGGGRLTVETFAFQNDAPMNCGTDEMPAGEWVAIAVRDTGCGIRPENMARILEPFFTTKDVGQGTGLGLATVYGIVRQTDGYLGIDSTVGQGTTFTIYLPRLPDTEVEQDDRIDEESEAPRDLTGTARILLVEDEDAVRTFSTRALTNKGYEVLDADSGESALEVIETLKQKHGGSVPVDLVVTDVIMPNMDGPTMARHLRAENPKLKIIFVSGYTEEKLKEHMGENIWFLPKPFTLKQLAEKVKSALDE